MKGLNYRNIQKICKIYFYYKIVFYVIIKKFLWESYEFVEIFHLKFFGGVISHSSAFK